MSDVHRRPSPLRAVLAAVRTASSGTGLDEIARNLGLSRDEVDAMVDYWEQRGELAVDHGGGCLPPHADHAPGVLSHGDRATSLRGGNVVSFFFFHKGESVS